MLDKELRDKLQPLMQGLQPSIVPTKATAIPAAKSSEHGQRTPEWVTRVRSAPKTPHQSVIHGKKEGSGKGQPAPAPPQSLDEQHNPLTSTVEELAEEIAVPVTDVLNAVVRYGLPRSEARPSLMLYASEVDILLEYFAERWKWRQDHPIEYRPSADGHISFETYERIPKAARVKLTADGFLPSLREFIKSPNRAWPQVKRHALAHTPQSHKASVQEVAAAPTPFVPFPTTTRIGSSLIPKMKSVLDPMSPMGYAKFFSLMRALLALDAKVSREVGSKAGYLTTNRQHAEIIDAVCKYGFGMFAYAQAGRKLEKKARSKPNPTRKKAIESLMRLRPMYQGLLTDVHHQRFVTWRVGDVLDFVEFRFEDMRDWLHGLETGQYVPLTTHITKVDGSSHFSSRDAALVNYMIQASENLRQGNTQRSQGASSRGKKANEVRSGGGGSSPSKDRSLGYRPVNTWLVPINVVEGQVQTELHREFFSGKPPAPHQVRSFYRRPKGSGPNALKTEFVSAHTRGATSLFHEPALLPSVTIVKK